MTERNGSGYISPTENKAVHRLTRLEEMREWKAENPLPPKSPTAMDEDALFDADRNRPVNKWLEASEKQEQAALIEWTEWVRGKYPELSMLFHIANEGQQRLTSIGVKAGVPDLCLPVARGGYHGLFIEMKARRGRLMENQKTWLRKLRAQGYYAVVAWGKDEAIEIIEEYLNEVKHEDT